MFWQSRNLDSALRALHLILGHGVVDIALQISFAVISASTFCLSNKFSCVKLLQSIICGNADDIIFLF